MERTAYFFTARGTPFFLPEIAGCFLEEGRAQKALPFFEKKKTPQGRFSELRPRPAAALATVPKCSRRTALRTPWTPGANTSGHHPAELLPPSR
jgi:hypothetical protein